MWRLLRQLSSYGVDVLDIWLPYAWLALLTLAMVAGCTALQAGKAKTDAGVDTTVIIRPDGSRIEHTIQHDKRDTDQGRATGLLKAANMESGGGVAGTLGGFSAKLTAATGGNWVIGLLMIVGGSLVAYYLGKWVYGIAIITAGILVCAYPINQILIVIGCLVIIGIVFYEFRNHLWGVVSGVKDALNEMPPLQAENVKRTLAAKQDASTQKLVKNIAAKA